MTTTVQKPATYADHEALPETVVGEILCGPLVTHPRPATPHVGTARRLLDVLASTCRIGVIVPDVAGWRRQRLAGAAMQHRVAIPPDWICETITESTARHQRGTRRDDYRDHGVQQLCHLMPHIRLRETFRLRPGGWLTHTFTDTGNVSAPPFAAITFSLGLLCPFDPPSEPT